MVTNKANVRAGIYVRISSDREGAGVGVAQQETDCRKRAKELGWDVAAIFPDNDISAFKGKTRPGYDSLVEAIKSESIDGLIIWHTDRLHRSVRELLDFLDLVRARGEDFQIQTVRAGQIDLSTPSGRALAITFGAWAQQESEHKSDRLKARYFQFAQDGIYKGGGTRAFGYEKDGHTLVPEEVVLIRDAARRILDSDETVRGLCREWNDKKIPTVKGNHWSPNVMKRMLVSARISGRREYGRSKSPAAIGAIVNDKASWPAIISPEDSDRLREVLSDPARRTNHAGVARRYLLTGFCFCGRCDAKLVARPTGNRERSYVCAQPTGGIRLKDDAGNPRTNPDGSPMMCRQGNLRIHGEALELYVKEAALDYLDEFVDLAQAVGKGGQDLPEAQLWTDLNRYQRRLDNLHTAHYVDETLDERQFKRLTAEVKAHIDDVRNQLAQVKQNRAVMSLPTSSAHARKLWDERGFEWQRKLIMTLVESVTVGAGVRGRNKFDPDRVKIKFRKPE